jgi:hypothetical protein
MWMEDLERFFYEGKPFLCLGLGVYALASSDPDRARFRFDPSRCRNIHPSQPF